MLGCREEAGRDLVLVTVIVSVVSYLYSIKIKREKKKKKKRRKKERERCFGNKAKGLPLPSTQTLYKETCGGIRECLF